MRLKANRHALRVTLIYIILAAAWILGSDELVKWLVAAPDLRAGISMFKDWALVLATGGLLFFVAHRFVRSGERDASEKLIERATCYRQLFELESDAVFLLDCETHRFLDVNQSAQRLYGYSREEFLGMTLAWVCDEPEQPRVVVGSSQFVPLRWHRKKNGRRFPVEISSKVFSCQGRSLKLATIRDTTARQQVMDMLEETSEQLSEAQHGVNLSPYLFDLKGSCKN